MMFKFSSEMNHCYWRYLLSLCLGFCLIRSIDFLLLDYIPNIHIHIQAMSHFCLQYCSVYLRIAIFRIQWPLLFFHFSRLSKILKTEFKQECISYPSSPPRRLNQPPAPRGRAPSRQIPHPTWGLIPPPSEADQLLEADTPVDRQTGEKHYLLATLSRDGSIPYFTNYLSNKKSNSVKKSLVKKSSLLESPLSNKGIYYKLIYQMLSETLLFIIWHLYRSISRRVSIWDGFCESRS